MASEFLRRFFCLAVFLPAVLPRPALAMPIDLKLARQYFEEAQAVCARDQGRLWGVSLAGPMLFVDPGTRQVVANQSDREGQLTPEAGVWVGRLPENLNIANTATPWAGVTWTMVRWPLPEDGTARVRLMIHELWHRAQAGLGFPMSNPANAHLDALEGRIWLQLEWRALGRALTSAGAERRQAIQDALTFRAYRRQLFPQARSEECELEMNEGLAEYTGVKLASTTEQKARELAARGLADAARNPSFVRSFAYATGPAYGLLLDEAAPTWRKALKPSDDLGALLATALALELPANLRTAAEERAMSYEGQALRAAETERENERQKRLAEYRARFFERPVLIIPLRKMNVQFDPRNLQPLEGRGTVYPTMRVSDVWGVLTVSGGALLNSSWTEIRVPAPAHPEARPLRGQGWTLELNPGWQLAPAERRGDFTLKGSSTSSRH